MGKKLDFAAIKARAASATRGMAAADTRHDERPEQTRVLAVARIHPRPHADTRLRDPEHVLALADSIAALGLLEPIVVDRGGHLLAGGHRLSACQLLDAEPDARASIMEAMCAVAGKAFTEQLSERAANLDVDRWREQHPDGLVPVRVMDFDAAVDQDSALAVEAAENTQRRPYTPKQVFELYQRLIAAGYIDRRGKPRAGERAVKPAIATVIGKSLRTVERIVERARLHEQAKSMAAAAKLAAALVRCARAAEQVRAAAQQVDADATWLRALSTTMDKLQKIIGAAPIATERSTSASKDEVA